MTRPTVSEKRQQFRRLHETGCFALPNPWDLGSACFLQGMGFKALASTSAGFAWSQARPDNAVTVDMVLAHLEQLVSGTDIPINADFENGFAASAAGVAENVRRAIEAGVAGLSIEDSTGDVKNPLFSIAQACERLAAARRAIDAKGGDTILVGRAECFLVGRPDLDETIERLQAYSAAGADCLYAPGISTPEQISAVVKALAPKPINLLVGNAGGLSMAACADLGVRRVSVGGALARAAWGGMLRAAKPLLEAGSFEGFADATPGKVMNQFFGARA